MMACFRQLWKPEFRLVHSIFSVRTFLIKYRQAWLDYCLINLTGRERKFYADDRFGKTIIKLNKEKVRPSANAKFNVFLRETIALNVMSLSKSKKILAQATGATWHENCHSIVNTRSDVILIVKLIQETNIFGIQPGRGSLEGSKFMDLFAKGSAIMNTGVPINNYKKRARRNRDQNKDGSNMFEMDKGNANVEKNNGVTLDSDYDSDNM